jgi:hypothetical protein
LLDDTDAEIVLYARLTALNERVGIIEGDFNDKAKLAKAMRGIVLCI